MIDIDAFVEHVLCNYNVAEMEVAQGAEQKQSTILGLSSIGRLSRGISLFLKGFLGLLLQLIELPLEQ